MAPIEETMMIAPDPRARIPGSAALVTAIGPNTLVAKRVATASSSPSSTAAR